MSASNRGGQPQMVDEWTLRERFNSDQIWERVQSGKLKVIEVSRVPGGSNSGQPVGTMSVMERISTHDGRVLAMTHHFERPDGSTTPRDPKYLLVGNTMWKLAKK